MAEFRENKDVRRPFLTTPDSRVFFPASTIEKARRTAARCLRRGEGIALVVGATGTGKTLLARTLASEFEPNNLVSVVSISRKMDVKSFLQQFMFGLRQSFGGSDETEMRIITLDHLERAPQKRCVLLVDDAHNLSLRVFDEIRVLIDQTAAFSKQLSVGLFGANALEDRLNLPILYPFEQRIAARAYLDVFTRDETCKYIDRELSRARVGAVFTKDAKYEVAELSSGVPRVVAQLCDRALFLASDGQLEALDDVDDSVEPKTKKARKITSSITIDVSEIERAWNNLQNIQSASEEETAPIVDDSSPVVEFGLLVDDDDEEEEDVAQSAEEPTESVETVEPTSELPEAEDEEDAEPEEPKERAVDWEVVRYGNFESTISSNQQEPNVEESDEQPDAEESDVEEETEEEDREERGVVRDAAPTPMTHEERRSEAKRAFWNQDETTVFIASLGTEHKEKEPSDRQFEEAEEPSSYEIDEALDARLREKFGFSAESAESESEDRAEGKAPTGSFDVFHNGMKFEVREKSELTDVQVTAFNHSLSRFASPTDEPSELSSKLSAKSNELFNQPNKKARYEFDASIELNPRNASTAFVENPKKSTRRPIVDGDDGSKEYREFNKFDAEDASRLAADESKIDPRYAAKPEPGETEPSLADRAYSQIVAATQRANLPEQDSNKQNASDRYLTELDLLEKEIEEEANLIRRIRHIHEQIRSVLANDLRGGEIVDEEEDDE
jgi:general secretion pathway protein A